MASLAIAAPAAAGDDALSVEAGLDHCGLSGERVVCQIDVSHGQVAGAESYEVLIAAPDGSAVASGSLPGGGASIWVPYAGDGTYSVTVSALGQPRGVDRPRELVAEQKADVAEADEERDAGSAEPEGAEQAAPPDTDEPEAPADPAPPPPDAEGVPEPAEPPSAGESPSADEGSPAVGESTGESATEPVAVQTGEDRGG